MSTVSVSVALAGSLAASSAASTPVFSDQTAAAGLTCTFDAVADTPGAYMLAGGAAGDFNNDGYQDLFVLSGGAMAPDHLFINNGDGTFTDQAAAWGVDDYHRGAGVAVGDYDGDGWLDIYVTSAGPAASAYGPGYNKLYHNNGDGTFTDVAAAAGVNLSNPTSDGLVHSAAFGDYDLDGDLDLFVTAWWSSATPNNGNRLFRNNGDGTFTDTTIAAGIDPGPPHGFSVTFADMNGDRYPELLLAADYYSSQYYINNGDGTFTNYTSQSGTGLDSNGMGNTVGDCNGDGLQDWYVTSIYSGSSTSGNMLYLNTGADVYAESSLAATCKDGGWGWGTCFADFNNDGYLDLVATQGWITNVPHKTRLFVNDQAGAFDELAVACGLDYEQLGRGVVTFDYDNDGDRDIYLMAANHEPHKLFRNDTSGSDAHWLCVALNTSANDRLAPNGVGAEVMVKAGGQQQYRILHGGSNYLSQSELSLHFGVGSAATIDRVRVTWPDGSKTVLKGVAANQKIEIRPNHEALRRPGRTAPLP